MASKLCFRPAASAPVAKMKYFLDLTDEEAAEVLGMKLRTVQRMWRDARQWLFERAEGADARAATS